MKSYEDFNDSQKKEMLKKEYENNLLSFGEIAKKYNTYSNRVRRDAIKFSISIRDKSKAQKVALSSGRHTHPTKGTERPDHVKSKIGMSVLQSWEELDDVELEKRKQTAKDNWEKLSDDEKQNILRSANAAVRKSSNVGSKLELFLLEQLIKKGYKVDFHKEQTLSNTKLQIDLFLPTMSVAIEVDGPSHFNPVWGEDALKKNQKYDNKKNGLILGKGLVLIRIKQSKDFSKSRASLICEKLVEELGLISAKFPEPSKRLIEIGD
jgi:very-short-patch-repair endonuclease